MMVRAVLWSLGLVSGMGGCATNTATGPKSDDPPGSLDQAETISVGRLLLDAYRYEDPSYAACFSGRPRVRSSGRELHVFPPGTSDTGDFEHSFTDLDAAFAAIRSGDTVFLHEGRHPLGGRGDGASQLTLEGAEDLTIRTWRDDEVVVSGAHPLLSGRGPAMYWTRVPDTPEGVNLYRTKADIEKFYTQSQLEENKRYNILTGFVRLPPVAGAQDGDPIALINYRSLSQLAAEETRFLSTKGAAASTPLPALASCEELEPTEVSWTDPHHPEPGFHPKEEPNYRVPYYAGPGLHFNAAQCARARLEAGDIDVISAMNMINYAHITSDSDAEPLVTTRDLHACLWESTCPDSVEAFRGRPTYDAITAQTARLELYERCLRTGSSCSRRERTVLWEEIRQSPTLKEPVRQFWNTDYDPEFACHAYLRLDPRPLQCALGLELPSTDPGDYGPDELSVYLNERIVLRELRRAAIEGIDFEALRTMSIQGSGDVDFVQNSLTTAVDPLQVTYYHDRTEHIRIRGNRFDQAFPRYVFWNEVKPAGDAHPDSGVPPVYGRDNHAVAGPFHTRAIEVSGNKESKKHRPHCVTIENNSFTDTWFGVDVQGEHLFVLNNRFRWAHEEAVKLGTDTATQVHVAFNEVFDSLMGVNVIDEGPPKDGLGDSAIYVHHNVVDGFRSSPLGLVPETEPADTPARATRWPIANSPPGRDSDHDQGSPGDIDRGFVSLYGLASVHGSDLPSPGIAAYNNTLVTGSSMRGRPAASADDPISPDFERQILVDLPVSDEDPSTPDNLVLNNVIVGMSAQDYVYNLAKLDEVSGEIFAGNLLWRPPAHPDTNQCRAGDDEDCCPVDEPRTDSPLVKGLEGLAPLEGHTNILCSLDEARARVAEQGAQARTTGLSCTEAAPSCEGRLFEHSVFANPKLDSEYRVTPTLRPARIAVPSELPYSDSPFIGACGEEEPCPVGPIIEP